AKGLSVRQKPESASYPQREAVLSALRHLTGADAGSSAEAWRRLLWRKELHGDSAQSASRKGLLAGRIHRTASRRENAAKVTVRLGCQGCPDMKPIATSVVAAIVAAVLGTAAFHHHVPAGFTAAQVNKDEPAAKTAKGKFSISKETTYV